MKDGIMFEIGKLYRVSTSVGILVNGRYVPVDSVFMLLSLKPMKYYTETINTVCILHNGKIITGVFRADFKMSVEKL